MLKGNKKNINVNTDLDKVKEACLGMYKTALKEESELKKLDGKKVSNEEYTQAAINFGVAQGVKHFTADLLNLIAELQGVKPETDEDENEEQENEPHTFEFELQNGDKYTTTVRLKDEEVNGVGYEFACFLKDTEDELKMTEEEDMNFTKILLEVTLKVAALFKIWDMNEDAYPQESWKKFATWEMAKIGSAFLNDIKEKVGENVAEQVEELAMDYSKDLFGIKSLNSYKN